MLSNVMSEIGSDKPLVKFEDWCAQTASETAAGEVELLMEFFGENFQHKACGGIIILETTNTRRASTTLRRASPMSDEVVCSYVRGWKRAGLLPEA
ncbi:hypothetical protein GGS21DRAFT_508086 [Xylaria nigripes]|nr:hypothetical protein GGS21DRAFT_508086 [Xylaria nigripes]